MSEVHIREWDIMTLGSKKKGKKEKSVWIDDRGMVRTGPEPVRKSIERIDDPYRLVSVDPQGTLREHSTGKLISKGDIGSRIKILRSALDGYERRMKTEPKRLGPHHFREYRGVFNEILKINDSRADDLKMRVSELRRMVDEVERLGVK